MSVPPAWGPSSLVLRGIWWHFNGSFIPEMPFPVQEKKKTRQVNRMQRGGDKVEFSQWVWLLWKEKTNGEEEYLKLSLRATGGRLWNILTYESVSYDWVTLEWNMWWTIWGLLTKWKETIEMKMSNSTRQEGNFVCYLPKICRNLSKSMWFTGKRNTL